MALAAARGGGIGVVDIEFAGTEPGLPARMLGQVLWLCDRRHDYSKLGLRLSPKQLPSYAACLDALDPRHTVVILAEPPDADALTAARGAGGRRVLVEVRSLADYRVLADGKALPDGVIACGHEAGGFVGDDTTFILLQKLLQRSELPVYARGGIGLHSAAGCRAAGAAGVVLDDSLLLTPESPLPDEWKQHLAGTTGHETVVVGQEAGRPCRVFDRPAFAAVAKLKAVAHSLAAQAEPSASEWAEAVEAHLAWGDPDKAVWPVGQGIGMAAALQRRFHGTEGIVQAIFRESAASIELAREHRPLAVGAPLARSHGTGYPIVQGPMTRVSDRPEFARAVAEGGALPLIALSMLRGGQIRPILEATQEQLGDLPWGVGILGFVPPELRAEQISEVRRVRPPFAIIAGGRPDLASSLEADGIATYLHVPVPSLLRSFLTQGARRFIFEGRECGGHVGPLCSFPLWEAMIEALLDAVRPSEAPEVHILFAGGIHDAVSGAILAAMAAPLAERGIRCGLLMGTAYLFTREAVETGAVVEQYQREAVACESTVLLTSGVGHANRVAYTPFADEFEQERRALLRADTPAEKAQSGLEQLMLGRLRLASKGTTRDRQGELVQVGTTEQVSLGMYMLGQVATLRSAVHGIAELHHDVCERAAQIVEAAAHRCLDSATALKGDEIAIIGIANILPGSSTPAQFWRNILDRTDLIREVPPSRWDLRVNFDADKTARDKTYSKWGGFIDDVLFDPIRYRIPPTVMPNICTTQLLALEASRRALADAGYADGNFDRDHTAVILGTNGVGNLLNEQLTVRTQLPHMFGEVDEQVLSTLPEWTGETFPGVLANVTAGRVANQFDLGGPNYTVDAACASSTVALDLAVRELESGRSNMALAGGVDTGQTPFGYIAFSKTQALSPTGRVRVFDKSADGTVISEGLCILVLKRLADARRDHNRIYAVIRGTGGSSDGRGTGLTAPKVEGQRRAVERALRRAGVSADTLGLYEAHGTGTQLGDRTELETLTQILKEANAVPHSCAVGSAKSLIGHTKMAAGAVGIAKAALALYHRVLPPQGGIDEPTEPLTEPASPIYTVDRPHPWLASGGRPRRAGVSAFGFGGTNSHLVLEEAEEHGNAPLGAEVWPCELLLFAGRTLDDLSARLVVVRDAITRGCEPRLADLALALAQEAEQAPPGPRLAIVAANLKELAELIAVGEKTLRSEAATDTTPQIMFARHARPEAGRTAFLFPGQGSQYLNMGWEPTLYFEELRAGFESADGSLSGRSDRMLSHYIFVPTAFNTADNDRQKQALNSTDRAQPAIGALSVGYLDLLERLGVCPDMLGGHSYGELTALHAAGVISRQAFFRLSEARGRAMSQCCGNGGMASIAASREQVAALVADLPDVVIANHNGPMQTVISGTSEGLAAALAHCAAAGWPATPLPVSGAFHSPLMAPALESWAIALEGFELREPQRPVYGNSNGTPYLNDPEASRRRIREHVLQPVEFATQVGRMYADGARTFIEIGPGKVLTRLVGAILKDQPHECVSLDPRQGHLSGLLTSLGALAIRGAVPYPTRLFEGRNLSVLTLDRLFEESKPAMPSATAWFINGAVSRLASNGETPVRTGLLARLPVVANPAGPAVVTASHANTPPAARPVLRQASTDASQAGILAAYSAYQETMRRFLDLEEQALSSFITLAQGDGGSGWNSIPSLDAGIKSFDPWLGRSLTANSQSPAMQPVPEPITELLPDAAVPDLSPEATKRPTAIEDLQDIVLQVLGKQTGYPIETMGLDLDLAGDLGIDSLRKVEFFTALAETLTPAEQAAVTGAMDEIMAASTIRMLLNRLRSLLQQQHAVASEPLGFVAGGSDALAAFPAANNGDSKPADAHMAHIIKEASGKAACPRFLPAEYILPLGTSRPDALRGTVLITEDGLGVARLIAYELNRIGVASILVGRDMLQDAEALRHCLRDGPDDLSAIVHLAPVAHDPMPGQFEEWRRLVQIQAKSLFHILHSGGQRLRRQQDAPPLRVVAASLMGGRFGRNGSFGPGLPIGGAGAGILKSLALEWPGTVAKAVDFDGTQAKEQMAAALLDELLHTDSHAEIGYPGGIRTVFSSVPAQHRTDGVPVVAQPSADWVVLATGGARGITADVLRTLARPGMTVVLAGRAAAPEQEPAELKGLADASALRAHFLEQATQTGETVTPVRVNNRVQEVMYDRERRRNLAQLQESGVNVVYRVCDVRTPEDVSVLTDWIYDTYGRLDALVHGAGIIEDKLLVDKDWKSFDRVFDTKVDSAYLLSRCIRPDTLKLVVFFGSVSGRVGSQGQTDYAAANEVLNRFAWWLREQWPKARIVTINWGPWASSGMATPLVQAQLKKRGIYPIEVNAGCAFFADEVAWGGMGEVEVLAGAGPWGEMQAESGEGIRQRPRPAGKAV